MAHSELTLQSVRVDADFSFLLLSLVFVFENNQLNRGGYGCAFKWVHVSRKCEYAIFSGVVSRRITELTLRIEFTDPLRNSEGANLI